MSNKLVQLIITAKDQATGVLGKIGAAMGGLGKSASGASGNSQSLGDAMFGAITKANLLGFAINKVGEAAAMMGAKFEEAKKIEIGDVSAASTFMALTNKSFAESQKFVSDFSKEISVIAGALPGATKDYNQVANSIMDNVIPAFQDANKVLDQEAFQKNLIDITKKMTLLGVASDTHAGAVGMFTARLLDGNIASARQLLFADNNPAFMNLLEKEVTKRGKKIDDFKKFTAKERLEIVQAVSGSFIKDEVINAASNTVEGLIAGIESSMFDPKSGVFGLLRDLSNAEGNQTVMTSIAGGIKALQSFFGAIASLLTALGVPNIDPMLVLYNGINIFSAWVNSAAKFIEQITKSVRGAGTGFAGLGGAIDFLRPYLNADFILKGFGNLLDNAGKFITNFFANAANQSGNLLGENGAQLMGAAAFVGHEIAKVIGGVFMKIGDFIIKLPWAEIFITIGNVSLAAIAAIGGAIAGFVVGWATTTTSGAMQNLSALRSSLWTGFTSLTLGLGLSFLNSFATIGQLLVPQISGLISSVSSAVSGYFASLGEGYNLVAQEIQNAVGRMQAGIGQFFSDLALGITFTFNQTKESISNSITWLGNTVSTTATDFFQGLGQWFVGLWESLKSAISQAIENAKNQIRSIVTAPLNAASDFAGGIATNVGNAANTAGSAVSGATSTVGGLVSSGFNSVFGGARYDGQIPTAASGLLGAFNAESRNMPPGASPVVANTSEFILTPAQMARMMQGSAAVGAASAGSNISIGNININGVQNPAQIADAVIAEIEARLSQFSEAVLA